MNIYFNSSFTKVFEILIIDLGARTETGDSYYTSYCL